MHRLNEHYTESKGLHLNYSIITDMIEAGKNVIDLGCGDGTLTKMLKDKGVRVSGIVLIRITLSNVLKRGFLLYRVILMKACRNTLIILMIMLS